MVDRTAAAVEALTATALEPVRAGGASGARGRLVAAAWMVGLAVIAGLAVVGRLAEPRVPIVTTAVVVAAHLTPSTPRPPSATARANGPVPAPRDLLVVTSPAGGGPPIRSVELIVQGFVVADAASLRVILETDGDRVDDATVRLVPAIRDRPNAKPHARFLVRLELPNPRPIGPMVVQVAAVDRDGERLAVVRRPFKLGPVVRPTLGDDGLLSGLVFSGA